MSEFIPPPGHPGVHRFINDIVSRNSPDKALTALNVIEKILKNIVNNPYEPKYRKINMQGKTYCASIKSIDKAEQLLLVWLGANITIIQHQEHLIFNNVNISRFIETIQAIAKKQESLTEQINKKDTTKQDEEKHRQRILHQIDNDRKERIAKRR